MRKPRSDQSPFDRHREQLDQWLIVENLSFDDTLSKLREVWPAGEKPPSRSGLARWAERRRQDRVLERISSSAAAANRVRGEFEANPSDAFGALLGMIGQAAFEIRMGAGESIDVDTLGKLAELVKVGLKARHDEAVVKLKADAIALQERRVALLEKQALEATDVLADQTLTPEQREAKMREIFGVKR